METPALKKSNATKYTVYFPLNGNNENATSIRKSVLNFVKKVFGGATVYKAEGSTARWGEEETCVLEILIEDMEYEETRIEQLAWLILCYLDNLKLVKRPLREDAIWFYKQPVKLYKLDNPDLPESTELKAQQNQAAILSLNSNGEWYQ